MGGSTGPTVALVVGAVKILDVGVALIEMKVQVVSAISADQKAGEHIALPFVGAALAEKAMGLCETKLSDSLVSIFILAVLCNIMIYIAVENYKNNPHQLGKYLAIFLGVSVFILCGFEHCIANMFYFSVANVWSLHTLGYLVVMTLGNLVGGVLPEAFKKLGTR